LTKANEIFGPIALWHTKFHGILWTL